MVTKNPTTTKKEVPVPPEQSQEMLRAACQAHVLAHMVYGQIAGGIPPMTAMPQGVAPYPPMAAAPGTWWNAWENRAPAAPTPIGPMPYPFPFAGYPR